MPAALSLLEQRHSAPRANSASRRRTRPPSHALLEAAIRVPDHGKLVPFRLLSLRGEAKLRFGEQLAAIAIRNQPELSEAKREKERLRYTFAPLVIVVIARIDADSKVPEHRAEAVRRQRGLQHPAGCLRAGLRRAVADRLGRLR